MTALDGFEKWMDRSPPWPGHFQEAFYDHIQAFYDAYGFDTFEELEAEIEEHWVAVLCDMVMDDFMSRETRDGNVVDQYLERRGWNEKAIPKAYMKGIRNSALSIYEASDIRPGESFMARDLILGGDPFLVTERSATHDMLQGEHSAMRIVEVRGHHFITGGMLPFEPDLSEQVIDEINLRADEAEDEICEMLSEKDEHADPEAIRRLSLARVLKMSAPLFSKEWMKDTMLYPFDPRLPDLPPADFVEIEYIELHCSFAESTTRKQLRDLLNAAPDMQAVSSAAWNWVALAGEEVKSQAKPAGGALYEAHPENGALFLGMIELKGRREA